MGKKVMYGNGHIGQVSDKVADILIKKGDAKLVEEKKPEAKK